MINVLFYLTRFPGYGGIETVTATLANAFVEKGIGVTILSHIVQSDACVSLRLDERVRVEHMPSATPCSSEIDRAFIENIVERDQITHIVFQDSYSPIERNLDGLWGRVKIIVCEHSMPYSYREIRLSKLGRLKHFLRHPLLSLDPYRDDNLRKRYLYDRCWRYLLLSKYYFGEFRALAKLFDSRKLRSMPNPLTTPAQVTDDAGVRKNKDDLIVFVGTLSQGKGAMRALKALSIIGDRCGAFKNWRAVFLGDGEEMANCRQYIQEHNIVNVEMGGYEPNVFPYLQRAKIYLHPSSRDGFPMTLVEAMSCGCVPVVYDSFGAVHDIVDNGQNGFIVPAYDADAFADSLARLIEDDKLVSDMSSLAIVVRQKFNVDNIIQRWSEMLRED